MDSKSIQLQLWDTAGQERFRNITFSYYRNTQGVIIVYDVTDKKSFGHIKDWLEDINKYTDNNPIKLIVGNKCDLSNEVQVTEEDKKLLKRQTGIDIIETSAKNSFKITEAMEMITRKLIKEKNNQGEQQKEGTTNSERKGISLNEESKQNNDNNNCCSLSI